MAKRLLDTDFRILMDGGQEPVSDGGVTFYLAGTNIQTEVWSDEALNNSLGAYVAFDADGYLENDVEIYGADDVSYDVKIQATGYNGGSPKTRHNIAVAQSQLQRQASVFPEGDDTPSVLNGSDFITAGDTAITNFVNGQEGQVITIYRGDDDIVIEDNAQIETLLDEDITLRELLPTASFRLEDGVWKEVTPERPVRPSGGTETLALHDLLAGLGRNEDPGFNGVFTDLDPTTRRWLVCDVMRLAGAAAQIGTTAGTGTFFDDAGIGVWPLRGAIFGVHSPVGGQAAHFATRTSDLYDGHDSWTAKTYAADEYAARTGYLYQTSTGGASTTPPSHTSGTVTLDGSVSWTAIGPEYCTPASLQLTLLNDRVRDGIGAWPLQILNLNMVASAKTNLGVEVNTGAVSNAAASHPYSITPPSSMHGFWFANGFEGPDYTGDATISSWFSFGTSGGPTADSIITVADDAITAGGHAFRLASGVPEHDLAWFDSSGNRVALIRSAASDVNYRTQQVFDNAKATFYCIGGPMGSIESATGSGVAADEYLRIIAQAASTGYVRTVPAGTASAVGHRHDTKGAGSHDFYVGSAFAAHIDGTTKNFSAGASTADRRIHGEVDDSTNTGVTAIARITHTTSATPGAGIGARFEYETETSNNHNEVTGATDSVVLDGTLDHEYSAYDINVMVDGVLTKVARLREYGLEESAYFNVRSPRFGAVGDGVTDDTAAFQAAIDAALASSLIKTVYVPDGQYAFPSGSAYLDPGVGGISIIGESRIGTVLLFDEGATDSGSFSFTTADQKHLFRNTTNTAKGSLLFRDIQFRGTWDVAGVQRGGFPMWLDYYEEITIEDCWFNYLTRIAHDIHCCDRFVSRNNWYTHVARDCIRARDCNDCLVEGNFIMHNGDDAIALHTTNDYAPVGRRKTVRNNHIVNGGPTKCLGGRVVDVSNNKIELSNQAAIWVGVSAELTEGMNQPFEVQIHDNICNDSLFITSATPGRATSYISCLISLPRGATATHSAVPGRWDSTDSAFIDMMAWQDYDSSAATTANAVPPALGVSIRGNKMMRTRKAATHFSDYGYGACMSGGVDYDPAITLDHLRPTYFIYMGANPGYRGLVISHNIGVCAQNGIGLPAPTQFWDYQNCVIGPKNIFDDYINRGVFLGSAAVNVHLEIDDNIFAGDIYRQNTNSNTDGTFDASGLPNGIDSGNVTGIAVRRNTFKNLCVAVQTNVISSLPVEDNVLIHSAPVATGFDVGNKGIGNVQIGPHRFRHEIIDADPTSGTFGALTNITNKSSSSMPSSGWYPRDWFVRDVSGSGRIEGWKRLTSGSAHVLDTDWAEVGMVKGPASSTDNAIARWDSTTGRLVQDSSVVVDDSGNIFARTNKTVSYILAHSGAQVSHTGDTNEYAFATITVPANAIGPNGFVCVWPVFTFTNSANNKTMRVRFGGVSGTQYLNVTATTTAGLAGCYIISNRNATNSQVGGASGTIGLYNANAAVVTSAVDTTASVDIVISGQLANAGETISLERYIVEVCYGA